MKEPKKGGDNPTKTVNPRGPKGLTFQFFGGSLKKARLAARWTQEELARMAELSVTTVRIAEGGKVISREAAIDIVGALEKTLDDFLPAARGKPSDFNSENGERKSAPEIAAIGSPEEDTTPVKLGDVAQATLTILEARNADDIAPMIFGRSEGEQQYEFIWFCEHLRSCRRHLDQVGTSFNRMKLLEAVFPKSVNLDARLEVTNSNARAAAFHIQKSEARDLISDVDTDQAPKILYEISKGGRFELLPLQSLYVNLEIKCFYRYEDFPEEYRDDMWALNYLRAAQRLRNHLLQAEQSSRGLPVNVDVLYGDGSRAKIRIHVHMPDVPARLCSWPCDIDGLGKALIQLHAAADPFCSLHQRRRTQLEAMKRGLTPEEQKQLDDRRRDALRRVLETTANVRHTVPPSVDQGRLRNIVDDVDAGHRGSDD